MSLSHKTTAAKIFAFVVFLFVGAYMLTAQIMVNDLTDLNNTKAFRSVICQFIALIIVLWTLNKLSHIAVIGKYLSPRTMVFILIAATVIPRLYLISSVTIVQTSDYNTYWVNALDIANENRISEHWQQYFGAIAANAPFVCSIFALEVKIFGANLNALLIMNVIFSTLAVLALYFIGTHFLGKMHSFTGVLLFALWPNNILGSIYLASEPVYVCFLLAGLAILLFGLNRRGKTFWCFAAGSGIVLSISQGLRPLTSVVMIALAILIMGYYRFLKPPAKTFLSFRQRAGFLGVVFFVYLGTSQLINMYTQHYLPVVSKPSFGWTLYEGNNPYAYGQWSQETSDALSQVVATHELRDIQPVLLQMAIEQLKAYDLKGYGYLVAKKSANLVGDGNYFYNDIAYTQTNNLILQGSYPNFIKVWSHWGYWLYKLLAYYLIYLCFRSAFDLLKNNHSLYALLIFLLPYAGICALHAFVTAIPRYGYPAIPFLILACALYHEQGLRPS